MDSSSMSTRRRRRDELPATPPHGPFDRSPSPSPPRIRRRLNTVDRSSSAPDQNRVVINEEAERPSPPSSPDSTCPICLSGFTDKSKTSSCIHYFCYECILQWAKVKSECPLCKTKFDRIFHNIRSDTEYEEFIVPAPVVPDRRSSLFQDFYFRLLHSSLRRSFARPFVTTQGRIDRSAVYDRDLWARDLRDDQGRTRRLDPDFYRANEAQTHRIRAWLNRELCALLLNLGRPHEPVCDQIYALLFRFNIVSEQFREHARAFLGLRTLHFMHELYVFARCPYTLVEYDRNVQYGSRTEAAWSPVFRLPEADGAPSTSSASSSPPSSLSAILADFPFISIPLSAVALRSHPRPSAPPRSSVPDDEVEVLTPPVARRSFAGIPPRPTTAATAMAELFLSLNSRSRRSPSPRRRTREVIDVDDSESEDESRSESNSPELPALRSFVGRHIIHQPPKPEPEPEVQRNDETVNLDSDSDVEVVEVRPKPKPELITLDDEEESKPRRSNDVQCLVIDDDIECIPSGSSSRRKKDDMREDLPGPSGLHLRSSRPSKRFDQAGPSGINGRLNIPPLPSASSLFDDVDLNDSGVRHTLKYARSLGRDSADVNRERRETESSESDSDPPEVRRRKLLVGKLPMRRLASELSGTSRGISNYRDHPWEELDSDSD